MATTWISYGAHNFHYSWHHAETITEGDAPRSYIFPFTRKGEARQCRLAVRVIKPDHIVAAFEYWDGFQWSASAFSWPATMIGGLARTLTQGDGVPHHIHSMVLMVIERLAKH